MARAWLKKRELYENNLIHHNLNFLAQIILFYGSENDATIEEQEEKFKSVFQILKVLMRTHKRYITSTPTRK